jgi:hypothetical protein
MPAVQRSSAGSLQAGAQGLEARQLMGHVMNAVHNSHTCMFWMVESSRHAACVLQAKLQIGLRSAAH